MSEPGFKLRFHGAAIAAGILTFVICILLIQLASGVWRGDWRVTESQAFTDVLALQGFEMVFVFLSALVTAIIGLTPIFLITAALRLWRVPHAICAGICGGAILLVIGLVRSPESAMETLWPGSAVYILAATVASLAFRYASLKEIRETITPADLQER